jgi:membrane protein YdbS with pleckstrin-like domain
MLTNEMMTETPPQTPIETVPAMDGPVIVAPGAPGALVQTLAPQTDEAEGTGPGVEGEATVWEGHYSGRNFLGRMIFGGLLIATWLVLYLSQWNAATADGARAWSFWTLIAGLAVILYWGNFAYRYIRAHRGHHYRLTNRRLFVTTGFFSRRVDQLELIRIKDVYVQQSMIGDWMNIGNVVVISSEQSLPKAYLLGIDAPRRIMDLIWHHMRIEQELKTTRINHV